MTETKANTVPSTVFLVPGHLNRPTIIPPIDAAESPKPIMRMPAKGVINEWGPLGGGGEVRRAIGGGVHVYLHLLNIARQLLHTPQGDTHGSG